ncbi:hypothetical protein PENSPDRAFT_680710 [Peniophora sp. CONT]|nr:hypothetical protein PENSPDRAFT_680710 [Peniophora sp. CONT]
MDAQFPPPDTDDFPAIIMMLQGLSQSHPGDFNTISNFLADWVQLGTVVPTLGGFPPLQQYEDSLTTSLNAVVQAFIAHPLPHLPILLSHIAMLHSFYYLRHAIARQELGAPEPGVDLLTDTREQLEPVLRVFAFLSPRMRLPEYSAHHETVTTFAVTLGLGLAFIKSMLPAVTPYDFYQSLEREDNVHLLRVLYACIEHEPPAALAGTVPPQAVLTNAEMMLPPVRWAREQLAWLALLRQADRISPRHCRLTIVELSSLRAPASLNVAVTMQCWREGCNLPYALNVKRCGRCKRVYYCGNACRDADWSAGHSTLCSTLANLRSILEHPHAQHMLQNQIIVAV